jgi:hypothetical protein
MGGNATEVEKIDAQIKEFEEKLANCKSHVASIDIVRELDVLQKKKEKMSKGWIIS